VLSLFVVVILIIKLILTRQLSWNFQVHDAPVQCSHGFMVSQDIQCKSEPAEWWYRNCTWSGNYQFSVGIPL